MDNKKKTLFISDIHMGAGKPWDWFEVGKESAYLVRFLEYIRERSKREKDIKELVLLGDVFDLWVCPHNETPHSFADIVRAQTTVLNAIKALADEGGLKVIYINGNHDFRVTEEDIEEAFDGKVKHFGDIYRRGNIHAEHGHLHAFFNCPDPKNGGPSRLPLGYYITRLHTTLGKGRSSKALLAMQAMHELLQVAGEERLPESVLDTVLEAAEKKLGEDIGSIVMNERGRTIDVETVRERYKNLYEDSVRTHGRWKTAQMIMCEVNRLGSIADELCRDGVDIVVFGHSHDTKMDKDSWFTKNRIYANCGYWCGFGELEKIEDNAHFVQTDGQTVELMSFYRGEANLVTSRHL